MVNINGYILCQAQGGLNDIACQIWVCTEYAIKYQREIILTHWSYFSSDLFDVFDFTDYPVKVHPITLLKDISYISVEPSDCNEYVELFKDKHGNFDKIYNLHTNDTRRFDKNRSYGATTLLLHDSCGGGSESVNFIQHVQFTKRFKEFFREKTRSYPPVYNAIHIRNTDIKTNVAAILNVINVFIKIPCFIGTDDLGLKHEILDIIPNTFSSSFDPIAIETNLHYTRSKDVLEWALIDLFTMVFSYNTISEVYLLAGEKITSGYSRLIDALKTSKDTLRGKLE